MIPQGIYAYDYHQLVNWLRNEAGSSNTEYFKAKKAGGLKLQQVPEEYAKLLLTLKGFDGEKYLALGIGNGGSFALECFFLQATLTHAIAVDNLAYGELINQNEEEINQYINMVQEIQTKEISYARTLLSKKINFVKESTDEFFARLQRSADSTDGKLPKFDVIFIDADHSYDGVKKDYLNATKHINKGGLIIFHDINSAACEGIKRIWEEVKRDHKYYWEFIHSTSCGIGAIQLR